MSGIWAVARNLIREVLRMRFLMAFVVVMTGCYTFGLALWLYSGTGPVNELVQTFLGYSFRFMSWFLSLLTIFLAIATIAREIKRKEIFTVTTKPVSRGGILVGKFLGLALFNAVLVAGTVLLIYALARVLASETLQALLRRVMSVGCVVFIAAALLLVVLRVLRSFKRRTPQPPAAEQFLTGASLPMDASPGRRMLTAAMCLMVLALVALSISRSFRFGNAPSEIEQSRLRELVFVARESVQPPLPDVRDEARRLSNEVVNKQIAEKKLAGPRAATQLREELYQENVKTLIMRQRAVGPGRGVLWHFSGIRPTDRQRGNVFLRYKHDVSPDPPDQKVYSEWLVGPRDPTIHGGGMFLQTRDVIRTIHELAVPVRMVSPTGDLYVVYRSPTVNAPTTVIFPLGTGIEALYVAGTFEVNMLRAAGMMYVRLLFLGILGLAAGAWVSFPVAVLLVLVMYFLGLASVFIEDAVNYETSAGQASLIRLLMPLFPKLAIYDPVPFIEKGRLVSGRMINSALLNLLLIKGGVAALVGYLIFKFRELARVVV